ALLRAVPLCTSSAPSGASWMCRSSSGHPGGRILLHYGNSSSREGLSSDRIPLAARASLETAPRREVAADVLTGDEVEARVRVGGRDEMVAVAIKEHLEHREEALQVGLLVDREVEMLVPDRPERGGQQVVPPCADAALVQLVLAHHLGDARRRAGVYGEQSPEVLVRQVGRLDLAALAADVDTGRDDVGPDRLARVADRVERAVDPRLNVLLARRCDEEVRVARRAEV